MTTINKISVRRLRDGRFEATVDGRRVISATEARARELAQYMTWGMMTTPPAPMRPPH